MCFVVPMLWDCGADADACFDTDIDADTVADADAVVDDDDGADADSALLMITYLG